jgi:hypothetical protein
VNLEPLTEIMDAWHDAPATGKPDSQLSVFLKSEVTDPDTWAVLSDPPRVALLFGRRILFVTPGEEGVAASSVAIPNHMPIRFETGQRSSRPDRTIGGGDRHWYFELPGGPLKITGWISDRGECDHSEFFARMLASLGGLIFQRP